MISKSVVVHMRSSLVYIRKEKFDNQNALKDSVLMLFSAMLTEGCMILIKKIRTNQKPLTFLNIAKLNRRLLHVHAIFRSMLV